jgi:hypothetical protein
MFASISTLIVLSPMIVKLEAMLHPSIYVHQSESGIHIATDHRIETSAIILVTILLLIEVIGETYYIELVSFLLLLMTLGCMLALIEIWMISCSYSFDIKKRRYVLKQGLFFSRKKSGNFDDIEYLYYQSETEHYSVWIKWKNMEMDMCIGQCGNEETAEKFMRETAALFGAIIGKSPVIQPISPKQNLSQSARKADQYISRLLIAASHIKFGQAAGLIIAYVIVPVVGIWTIASGIPNLIFIEGKHNILLFSSFGWHWVGICSAISSVLVYFTCPVDKASSLRINVLYVALLLLLSIGVMMLGLHHIKLPFVEGLLFIFTIIAVLIGIVSIHDVASDKNISA